MAVTTVIVTAVTEHPLYMGLWSAEEIIIHLSNLANFRVEHSILSFCDY